jgi:hypothetical protein
MRTSSQSPTRDPTEAHAIKVEASRLDELAAIERMVAYSEGELRRVAPGCSAIAGLLRNAIAQEIVAATVRRAMAGSHDGAA